MTEIMSAFKIKSFSLTLFLSAWILTIKRIKSQSTPRATLKLFIEHEMHSPNKLTHFRILDCVDMCVRVDLSVIVTAEFVYMVSYEKLIKFRLVFAFEVFLLL